MAKKSKLKPDQEREKKIYIFVEGETELYFYKRIFDIYLQGVPKTIKNLKSGSGINIRIVKELATLLKDSRNHDVDLYIYVFLDREGPRSKQPEFNQKAVIAKLETQFSVKNIKVLDTIEAICMIESWFFHDLETLLNHIGLKHSPSIIQKYNNPETLGHRDLETLFKKGRKNTHYQKGDRGFLDKLDIQKIYNKVPELKEGISRIREYK